MKRILRRYFFLSVLCCTFLAMSFFARGGIASAASRSLSVPAKPSAPAYDYFYNVERVWACVNDYLISGYVVLINTGPVCFKTLNAGPGYADINVYSVTEIFTGPYNLTFDWKDCHGYNHYSTKPPNTLVTAANSGGDYGGCLYMQDVYYIHLS